MEPSPALACYIRGCPNEFGMVDPKQLLYVCTADDIQCKAWLTAIPKVSLKDVDDKLCLCSLHFENGVNVGGDSLPTIFPPLPGTSEIITDDPLPPAPVVPPIRIKEEPVDDYEQTGPQSSELESSVNLDSLPAWEDEESSMEVDHVAGASAARRNSFIPPHKIKREIDDSNEAGTSSSTQDSTSVDDGSHFLQFVTSYVVKDEPHEDNAEVAAPPPGSGCGVVEIVQRSSAFEIQEEFGEILVENIKTEEEDPAESPTVPPPASLPSAPAVTIKTEPLDPDEVVTNGFGEPSTSHDQGCQADPSSTVLMPPGFISEPPAPSSVASGPTAFVAGNVGALTGDTGFVISEVYSVAGGQQECAEDKAHCPRCVNNEGKQVRDKSTCTNLPTRTVWTQTVEPDKRTVSIKEEMAKKLHERRIEWRKYINSVACSEEAAQATSQKEKKAKREQSFQRKLDFADENSCSSGEELAEKKAPHADDKQIEKLQCEIRSLKKKLAKERQRNRELQEVIIKGMGEVQEQLRKRSCRCSVQQQVGHSDITATTNNDRDNHASPEPQAVPDAMIVEPAEAAPASVEPLPLALPLAQKEMQMPEEQIPLPSVLAGGRDHRGAASEGNEAQIPLASVSAGGGEHRGAASEGSEAQIPLPSVSAGGGEHREAASEGNEVHLACGVRLPREKWLDLLEQPKDSLFVRETTKALWNIKDLFNRSITGTPCRRFIRKEGVQRLPERRALTPEKLQALRRTQVAQLGDLRMLTHRATQTDPWLERSPRLPKVTRRKRRYEDDDDPDKL